MVEANAQEMREILKSLSIQQAASTAAHGMTHASRIAVLSAESWQAEILRHSPEVPQAKDPAELRALMGTRDVAVIFLPRNALVTAEIIDRICYEAPFNKMIIWEQP